MALVGKKFYTVNLGIQYNSRKEKRYEELKKKKNERE